MRDSRTYVKWEMEELAAMKQKWKKTLTTLPKGKLARGTSNGHAYYYQVDGREKIYLGGEENRLVQALKKRRLLETMAENIDANTALMERYLREYREVNLTTLSQTLPKAYRIEEGNFPEMEMPLHLSQWEMSSYDKSRRNPAGLKILTAKGDYVRSKSEALIANMLYEQHIPYHYEETLLLGEKTIAPDFKIAVSSENRFKYLEHCGMMGSEQYFQGFIWKMRLYLQYGYIPWRDVFFTFDNFDNGDGIDTKTIRYLIDCYFR